MMKLILTSMLFCMVCSANGQNRQTANDKEKLLTASNYLAYPGPQRQLTAAPKGYTAVYISHYGRHGSRYLIGTRDYNAPLATLQKADSVGKLTPLGHDVMLRLAQIRQEAAGRDGELTQRGAEQHREIAQRMIKRFPTVFANGVHIDARSTVVIRCILSMENALQQLIRNNNTLRISHDASYHDMYYMNQSDPKLEQLKKDSAAMAIYNQFAKRHYNYKNLMNRLFNDSTYWQKNVDALKLNDALYKLASNVQSTELRHKLTLYDIFTLKELHDDWLRNNAWWYITYGPSPLNGGTQPYSQRNLLRNIIHTADSCLQLKQPGATLRYGHDTMVMPLTCLLDINGYGKQTANLDSLEAIGWKDYKIFPMAANLQFIFYKSTDRKNRKQPILVKVLQNEDEAKLPIHTDQWPYYKWEDFKNYYLDKLNRYKD